MENETILWKIPNSGLTSKSVYTQDDSNPMANYGASWKFADRGADKLAKEADVRKAQEAPVAVGDIIKREIPVEIQDAVARNPDASNQDQRIKMSANPFDKGFLKGLGLDELKSVAASVGVVNINQTKSKLIDAIAHRRG